MVKGSVGKTTNYLVVGDGAGGTKTNAAAKNGVACIDEEALLQLIGG
jgi:NAD-dependent DNA ligase